MLETSPAVRRELDRFELAQIWVNDRQIRPLDREQAKRMVAQFETNGIPLHAIVDPRSGRTLARFEYNGSQSDADYAAFLRKGLAAYEGDAHNQTTQTVPPR